MQKINVAELMYLTGTSALVIGNSHFFNYPMFGIANDLHKLNNIWVPEWKKTEVQRIYREGGALYLHRAELPLRAPHYTVSDAGLYGYYSHEDKRYVAGELDLAAFGVLVFDNYDQFRPINYQRIRNPNNTTRPAHILSLIYTHEIDGTKFPPEGIINGPWDFVADMRYENIPLTTESLSEERYEWFMRDKIRTCTLNRWFSMPLEDKENSGLTWAEYRFALVHAILSTSDPCGIITDESRDFARKVVGSRTYHQDW